MLILFVAMILAGISGVVVVARGERKRQRLIAGAPPGALVSSTDPLAVAKVKREAYARHMKAMSLLSEVRAADEGMAFMPGELRRRIDEFIEESYEQA